LNHALVLHLKHERVAAHEDELPIGVRLRNGVEVLSDRIEVAEVPAHPAIQDDLLVVLFRPLVVVGQRVRDHAHVRVRRDVVQEVLRHAIRGRRDDVGACRRDA
jgi:hypothetical protein